MTENKISQGLQDALAFVRGHNVHKGTLTINGLRIDIERGQQGLFYATSPEIRGLLVAEPTIPKVLAAIPAALIELGMVALDSEDKPG